MNYAAADKALSGLIEVPVPEKATSCIVRRPPVPADAPEFVKDAEEGSSAVRPE